MKVKVLSGQSLTDIAIQVYGSAEGVFALAQENGMSVTDETQGGQELGYTAEGVSESGIVRHYAVKGIYPATMADSDGGVFDDSYDLTFA